MSARLSIKIYGVEFFFAIKMKDCLHKTFIGRWFVINDY